jgi:hypothetical protein
MQSRIYLGGFMTYGEYVKQYVTLENALEYARLTDKMAFVSDITGLSIDHRFIGGIEDRLDRITTTKVGAIPANFFFSL